jgi:dTDP-4-amino-4,6-dideoxygalactose transaminase
MIISGIKTGDEVICPSLTFVATVNAIRYVGAIPVFCDISSKNDLTISPEEIEQKITKKTRAILIMHYAGFPCDMKRIMSISKKHNIIIIEDACHAPLSEYNGQKLGTFGTVSCYSFFSNKNISTGEGGMLVTNNKKYFEKAKLLRSHGMTTASYDRSKNNSMSYDVLELGYNYRLDDIRASIALVQLSKLKKDIKQREKIRKLYIKYLKEIKGISIPFSASKGVCSNYIFPILVENRDEVRKYLAQKGIQTSIHYQPVHRFNIYKKYYKELPVTDNVADRLLTLPMYSSLKEKDIIYIKECLMKIVK